MPQHFLQSGLGDCVQKKGCVWHHVTHEQLNEDDLESSLRDHSGVAVLKFEPFILHVRCSSLEDARKLLAVSLGAGCRNSGIMLSKTGNVHVAVRTTLSMEVPLSEHGNVLVTPQYLKFLTTEANKKMIENWKRLERFSSALQDLQHESQQRSSHSSYREFSRTSVEQCMKSEAPNVDDYSSISFLFAD